MQKNVIRFLVLLLCFVFVPAAVAEEKKQGWLLKVFLFNRVTQEIRTDCEEIMGKYDANPGYECPDAKTQKKVPFDLGKDWQPVRISRPVCVINKVNGVVKNDCVRYESRETKYLDIIPETGKYVVLEGKWEPLSPDNPQCKPTKRVTDDDPIKGLEFDIITDLEKPAETGDNK